MRIQDTRFVILDTETTGIDPNVDKVVEIALVEVSKRGVIPIFDSRVNPQREIPPTASAVHHITDRDVENAPTFEEVWPTVMSHVEGAVIVAHNAKFDRAMIPETNRPWICSYRLARHLFPDAPAFNNQTLRYWMKLDIKADAAHSAAGDTLVTGHVFFRELASYRKHVAKTNEVEELIAYAESPIPVHVMPFGKHKGQQLVDVPPSYITWALQNLEELDDDLRLSLEQVAAGSES